VTIRLPPLRERADDILLLAEHFLARACTEYDLPARHFSADACAALMAYGWPGNVRELSNILERVVLLIDAPLITAARLDLPQKVPAAAGQEGPGNPILLFDKRALQDQHVQEALHETGGNVTRAAQHLGVSRDRLRYWIEKRRQRGSASDSSSTSATSGGGLAAGEPRASTDVGFRWERRYLAYLRIEFLTPSAAGTRGGSTRALSVIAEKVESFAGTVYEVSATGIDAVFGLTPAENAPAAAALTALGIVKAAERWCRAGATPALTLGIHVGDAMVGRFKDRPLIDEADRQRAWTALEELVARREPPGVWVNAAAAPFLDRQFELVAVGRDAAARPMSRIA